MHKKTQRPTIHPSIIYSIFVVNGWSSLDLSNSDGFFVSSYDSDSMVDIVLSLIPSSSGFVFVGCGLFGSFGSFGNVSKFDDDSVDVIIVRGDAVGILVGTFDGEYVGNLVGIFVGDVVGILVGDADGTFDGESVGNSVGALDGIFVVGEVVGTSEGEAVGNCVGDGVTSW